MSHPAHPLRTLGVLLALVLLVTVGARIGAALPGEASLATSPADITVGVVDVNTVFGYQNARGAATGIVMTSDGEVLTNDHVINGATAIRVMDPGTGRSYPADVLGYDRARDIAVLRLRGAAGLATARLGDSSRVAVGEQVAAIGNAGGVGGTPHVSRGTVTGLGRWVSASDELTGAADQLAGLIEVAADIEPGDSGGPLVDENGQVIGVDTAASASYRYHTAGGTGFAIPTNSVLPVVRQIEAGHGFGTVHVGPTGVLGVTVHSVEHGSSSSAQRSGTGGVSVDSVRPGSPADQAGLGQGDLLTELDGRALDTATTLTNLLVQHHPGDRVSLGWVDSAGDRHTATVTLVPGPPA